MSSRSKQTRRKREKQGLSILGQGVVETKPPPLPTVITTMAFFIFFFTTSDDGIYRITLYLVGEHFWEGDRICIFKLIMSR